MTLHELIDWNYGADGDDLLRRRLEDGSDPNLRQGPRSETPLHVATRRCRVEAVQILLAHGAAVDAVTLGGKTAYAHAVRRGFDEVAELLKNHGADTTLNVPDQLAVAIVGGRLEEARILLSTHPEAAMTGNAEEDRLLSDIAGRNDPRPVELLIRAGADLTVPGVDSGTPLHVAAWFGQPDNARLLIEAGAPLDVFDDIHSSSPIGWAVHGSRYSGDPGQRQDAYVAVVQMLLLAGSKLHYPNEPADDAYFKRLLADAGPEVRELLQRWPRPGLRKA